MNTHVTQWGNSLGLRIPMPFAKMLGIEKNTEIDLTVEEDKIILRKKMTDLNELLARIKPGHLHPETNTGRTLGNEQW